MLRPSSDEVAHLSLTWRNGEQEALHELISVICEELRRLAHNLMHRERRAHTLEKRSGLPRFMLRIRICNPKISPADSSMAPVTADKSRSPGMGLL